VSTQREGQVEPVGANPLVPNIFIATLLSVFAGFGLARAFSGARSSQFSLRGESLRERSRQEDVCEVHIQRP
jgi:hypothetical protein